MKKLLLIGAAGMLLVPLVALADISAPLVTVCETVMPTRYEMDNWQADGGAAFAYTNGEALVTAAGTAFRVYHHLTMPPGVPQMKGGVEYVMKTDPAFPGTVTMILDRKARDKADTNTQVRATAPWRTETRFATGLDASERCTLQGLYFTLPKDAPPPQFRLLGLDAVTRETPAQALRVDIDTGNPHHLVRDGKGEAPVLVLRNPSARELAWDVSLVLEDFFGNRRERTLQVKLDPGGEMRRPVDDDLPKGIRYVTIVVSCEGSVATNRTTYARIDLHEVTPPQPETEFRLGVHYHAGRYTPASRRIGTDAAVAIGAKLIRTDILHFCSTWPAEDTVRWEPDEAIVDSLIAHGFAIDAVMWWPSVEWALIKDPDGSLERSGRRAFKPGILRRYGEMLGSRFGAKIAYYEVGNEWDMTKPDWLPYEDAVRQVREVAEGVKATCPAAKVIPGGFASDSSVRHPSHVIRPMFQENLMRDVQDIVDAHPIHGHGPFKEFSLKMRYFLQWRKELGVNLPWYANETAISTASMRPTDRAAAVMVWQKILFTWSRGSIDYIWYNLRATSWEEDDKEGGFGMFTADFHPRSAAAAFAAMATTFRHLAADGLVFDGKDRQVMRFRGRRAGRDVRVIAGWDMFAANPMDVRVRTDAKRAWQVDTMGNRTEVPVSEGAAVWAISCNPSALFLEDASRAEPDAKDAAREARRPVKVIVPGPEFASLDEADLVMKEYEQVYEVFKAMPEHVDRTWKWWEDLWVWVNTAYKDGKLSFRFTCWDDVHHAVPEDPLSGDCVVLRLGGWRILLTGTEKNTEVRVLAKPDGAKNPPPGALKLSYECGYHQKYILTFDPKVLGFDGDIPLNVRVYDNDGKGFDGWIEYTPLDEDFPAVMRLNPADVTALFNGRDLCGWYTYLQGRGKNVDPKGVFSVADGVIHVTGEEFGALVTEKEYSDYHLSLEYRFTGGAHFGNKIGWAPDSGILFHSTGPDGGFHGIWMEAIEANLIKGATGDFWGVGMEGSDRIALSVNVGKEKLDGKYAIYDEKGGDVYKITGNTRVCRYDIARDWQDTNVVAIAKNENSIGEWNRVDLHCVGGDVVVVVNGKTVNRGFNAKPRRGRIQLQSEGCPVEFRNITIVSEQPWGQMRDS